MNGQILENSKVEFEFQDDLDGHIHLETVSGGTPADTLASSLKPRPYPIRTAETNYF